MQGVNKNMVGNCALLCFVDLCQFKLCIRNVTACSVLAPPEKGDVLCDGPRPSFLTGKPRGLPCSERS